MMLKKKIWFDQFIQTDKYKNIINCIDHFPYPNYMPVLDPHREESRHELRSQRHKFYLKRIVPLTSFYYIDYIDKQTNGGEIINICDDCNYYAGMYNIKLWNGKTTFVNQFPVPATMAVISHQNKYDNIINVCEHEGLQIHNLSSFIEGLSKTIKTNHEGYGYIAMCSQKIRFCSDITYLKNKELNKYYRFIDYVDNSIYRGLRHCEIIAYENNIVQMDDDVRYFDDFVDEMDGDIRVLFKTRPSTKA